MSEEDIKEIEELVNLNYYGNMPFLRDADLIRRLYGNYKEQEKVIDEIIKEFLRGTEYYFSEFDYMNKEDIKQYFINKVKENKE